MDEYKQRVLERIRLEAALRGEDELDLAKAARANVRTAERWLSKERFPQLDHRKALAKHWKIPIAEFQPDVLAAMEEKRLQDQLNRIETKLDDLLLGAIPPAEPPADASDVPDSLRPGQDSQQEPRDEGEPETGEEGR